jgi:hypothetical protein
LLTAAWVVWKITAAIDQLPPWLSPWVMIVVGLIIFGIIMVLLYFAIGGKASISSKKRNISLGR